ncbi:MAG: TM0106 family RecB-like putative nuclease [Cumulibacter sp.]
MRLEDGRFYYTPSDLRGFAICQLSALRHADALLGRGEAIEDTDVLGQRMGDVGRSHQQRVLEDYLQRYGAHLPNSLGGVAVLSGANDPTGREAAAAMSALASGAQVLAQVPISAGSLYGSADLLLRIGERWQLTEVRLGLRVKDVYLLQIGAIALALLSRGVPLEAEAILINGNDARLDVALPEAMERARAEMARFDAALARRLTAHTAVSWEDDSVSACGWCDTCREAMTVARDVRLTAGVRMPDRVLLRAAGVRTLDELAVATGPVDGLEQERFATIRAQARLQVRQMPPGTELDPSLQLPPVYEVYDEGPLRAVPAPDPLDIFFDMESDPMWAQGPGDQRGLHYLFGMCVPSEPNPYVTFWAHDRDAEREALLNFVKFVSARLRRSPQLHVYHYGNYETAVLMELVKRHAVAEEEVTAWLSAGLFIDLLPVVKGSVRTSQSGYGLKKIEPLYMSEQPRTGTVLDGASSVLGYQQYMELRESGRYQQAGAALDAIAAYNEYDCMSTRLLRDWLLTHIA